MTPDPNRRQAVKYMRLLKHGYRNDMFQMLSQAPTILWFFNWEDDKLLDLVLNIIPIIGMALSAIVIIIGSANVIAMAALWVLYKSIASVGQIWFRAGFEKLLLETGFLAIWFVPFWSFSRWRMRPGTFPRLANLCLLFRLLFGVGLMKLRNDKGGI